MLWEHCGGGGEANAFYLGAILPHSVFYAAKSLSLQYCGLCTLISCSAFYALLWC
jgi:hypothetical protein